MSTLNLDMNVRADWYWTLPALGFDIAAHVGSKDAPKWFHVKINLLFLHMEFFISSKHDPGEDIDEGEAD